MSIIAVNDDEFGDQVLNSDKPVIVDFWAEWCGPCKQFGPVFEEVSNNVEGVTFAKVNIDENPEAPTKYGVRGIPTLIMFKGGEVASTKVGAVPKSNIVEWVEQNL